LKYDGSAWNFCGGIDGGSFCVLVVKFDATGGTELFRERHGQLGRYQHHRGVSVAHERSGFHP